MKALVFTISVFLLCLNPMPVQSDFCSGFTEGFCSGYRNVKGDNAVCPVTPTCPVAEIGKDSYKGGYNTGFIQGLNKAKQ